MAAILALAVLAALCAWSSAVAQQYVEIGLLECSLSEPIDAEGSDTATAAPARHILCAFNLKSGITATYTGRAQVLNLPARGKATLLWLVKAPSTMPTPPGFLQQGYSADPKTPAGQIPDMIGEANAGVVLQSMADKKEGSASTQDKSPALGVVVLRVELKLKTTTGGTVAPFGSVRGADRDGAAAVPPIWLELSGLVLLAYGLSQPRREAPAVKPKRTRKRGTHKPTAQERVADRVEAYRQKHGHAPEVADVRQAFGVSKITAWRRIRSAS